MSRFIRVRIRGRTFTLTVNWRELPAPASPLPKCLASSPRLMPICSLSVLKASRSARSTMTYYYLGYNPSYPPHYPYYDVTSGCNSNDVTILYGTGAYCAGTGYDLTTGWGSFNALQLSWAINSYWLGAFEPPTITLSGPSHTQGADNWYNTDQTVSWTVKSNAESHSLRLASPAILQAGINTSSMPLRKRRRDPETPSIAVPKFPMAQLGRSIWPPPVRDATSRPSTPGTTLATPRATNTTTTCATTRWRQ